jgi:DSF synthase
MAFHSRVFEDASLPTSISLNERRMGIPISSRSFDELIVRHDQQDRIFWCFMNQQGRPSYTYKLGAEIQEVQDWIANNYAMSTNVASEYLHYFVCGSKTPGVYNLGGDLRHFAECIRNGDLAAMRNYAEICVRMQYANSTGFGAPIITMALVQGDALGGGFEHALSFDIIVAEKSARMGLPEIIFNLFPGMGAYSFLLRKVGRRLAEKFILDGNMYTAEQLYDMGIVDILVEDGQGEAAIVDYCQRHHARFSAERAVYLARRTASPVELEELLRITHIWAETAMGLSETDIRKMERLADAQERRMARTIRGIQIAAE